jgi:hypothetical protein
VLNGTSQPKKKKSHLRFCYRWLSAALFDNILEQNTAENIWT